MFFERVQSTGLRSMAPSLCALSLLRLDGTLPQSRVIDTEGPIDFVIHSSRYYRTARRRVDEAAATRCLEYLLPLTLVFESADTVGSHKGHVIA